ncbi:MAG: hypothetical protein JXR77_05230, partial [Lentisphaeria bacterium]|nr:hypothetical protein [Lentisphaeria bacterium]
MKRGECAAFLALTLVLVSCTHTQSGQPSATTPGSDDAALLQELRATEHREVLKAAGKRLDEVRKLVDKGDIKGAEAALQPLIGQDIFANEVAELRLRIAEVKGRAALDIAQRETEQRALTEVEQRLVLPSKYNSTVVIRGSTDPILIPKGPVEDLLKRRVTINVRNAGYAELVEALNQIEGLSFIADETLEAEKPLTIRVTDTPLCEVLGSIADIMGVDFHVSENVAWLMERQGPAGGPELETQVYRLRRGTIPTLKAPEDGGGGGGGGRRGSGGATKAPENPEDTDLEDALTDVLGGNPPEGATFRLFRNRNLLLVKDTRDRLRLVEALLDEFDRPPYQVLIEARFLTIAQGDLFDLGVDITDTTTPAPGALLPEDPEQIRL